MIKDSSRYYGAAISSLVDLCAHDLRIGKPISSFPGVYLVDEKIPIYIKYSTSRRGPWTFNFQRSHQEIEQSLFLQYGECIIMFVCGKDGIAALRHADFRTLLDEEFEDQESVSIRRKHNEMYNIRGKNGPLGKKVSRRSLEEVFKHVISTK